MSNYCCDYGGVEMKKRKIFILSIAIFLLFAGCSKLVESTVNIDELNTVSGISMSEVDLENERLVFTLINDTDETMYYGTDISLEKKINGKWYEVPFSGKVSFLAILLYLSPHSEKKIIFPLDLWKEISSGTYRFIKEFYLNETLKESKYIFKEFEY